MCVIMYKPAGVEMPCADTIRACFEANPHGAGYMLPKRGKVAVSKGFMDLPSLMAALASEGDLTDVPVVVHFRITTQGGVQPSLCHPFPVCDSYAKMRLLGCECDVAVAHNGVIAHCSNPRCTDRNDTMEWVKRFADPVVNGDPNWFRSKKRVRLLSERSVSGGSRFAVMSRNGFVQLIGDWRRHSDGCMYSNTYWLGRQACRTAGGAFSLFGDADGWED